MKTSFNQQPERVDAAVEFEFPIAVIGLPARENHVRLNALCHQLIRLRMFECGWPGPVHAPLRRSPCRMITDRWHKQLVWFGKLT